MFGKDEDKNAKSITEDVNHYNSRTPDVDVWDEENALRMYFDLPGVEKGNASIEVDENNILTVKAIGEILKTDDAVFKEYNQANFYRVFTLNKDYNRDKIEANLDNGVLSLYIPKRDKAKPTQISISA